MTDQEKLDWLNRLVKHHITQDGHFKSTLKHGLDKLERDWKQHVRARNADLRASGEL